jgi:hypothetical protein
MLPAMAAEKKSKGRRMTATTRKTDIQEIFGLHFQASRRVEEILEQVQELRLAGRVREAKALLKRAETLRKGLRELEAEVRSSGRAPK